MARTAPVPNIPPIPGMCPGIAVLGGGGGSGGAGGKGAGQGGGGVGAGGEGGADATDGDGRGADACAAGSNGSCTGCGSNMSAGDPVDVATGRVYTGHEVDIQLPGPLPLVVLRKYSSASRKRDVGLGWGWSHSLAWEIRERRRKVEIWDSDGSVTEVDKPPPGGSISASKSRMLYRVDGGYVVHEDDLWRFFSEAVRINAGTTLYKLTGISDEHQNFIELRYGPSWLLVGIKDSVGREVHVSHHPDGHIAGYSVKNAETQGQWIRLAQFDYDQQGHLIRATDADGFDTTFTYERHHLLTSHHKADSPVFHFVYDELHRCIETWGDFPDGNFPGLHPDVGDKLADGSPAKGILHCKLTFGEDGFVELIDSRRVRQFYANAFGTMDKSISGGGVTTREFDKYGNLIGHTDEEGATYRFVRDPNGNLLKEIDPLGHVTEYLRDDRGRPLEVRDSMGIVLQARYAMGDRLAELTMSLGDSWRWVHDKRGLVVEMTRPDGGKVHYEHDAYGNLVKQTLPDGQTHEWSYDYLGRVVSERLPNGQTRRYSWTNRRLCSATFLDNSDVLRFSYDGRGQLTQAHNNVRAQRVAYNGLGRVWRVINPDNTYRELLYDREGDLVEYRNERGEARRYEVNHGGLPTRIENFDGRVDHYKYDGRGRLIKHEDAFGNITELVRDALGRIVEVIYADDTSTRFEYDVRSQLTKVTSPTGSVSYERNAAGQIIKEMQQFGGRTFVLERQYDVMRALTRLESSLGHTRDFSRDAVGNRTQMVLDGREVIGFDYRDGREIGRTLSGRARIEHRWDSFDTLLERRLVAPAPRIERRGDEPEWIGPPDPGAVVRKVFEYNQTHNLVRRFDTLLGDQSFEYDLRERVVRSTRDGHSEAFWYDDNNNVYEPGKTSRRYALGDTLMRKGNVSYSWDGLGHLIAKRVDRGDGHIDEWHYSWTPAGELARVETPDKRIVSFTYDPWSRRQTKCVERLEDNGVPRIESMTHFVWDEAALAHEIRQRFEGSGDPVIEERTYAYDRLGEVMAHRDARVAGGERDERWLYYLNDHHGTPEQLVTAGGDVVCELERSVWGDTTVRSKDGASTPLRFQGQYADDDIGLHYNRYRYYDPDTGRYISADPAGNLPDPNLFHYTQNPVDYLDPLGLVHTVRNATFTPGDGSPPMTLGNNGTVKSNMDPQARQDMTATDASGNAVHTSNQNRSDFQAALNNPTKTPANRGRSAGMMAFSREHFNDTEAKAMREVERRATPDQLNGGTLNMVGELPPCGFCQARMADFARRTGANVEYRYPHPNPTNTFRVQSNGRGVAPTVTPPADPNLPPVQQLPPRGQ